MDAFPHEAMPVYHAGLDLFAFAGRIVRSLPPAFRAVGDQLLRSALSIPLNTGEGAAEFPAGEKQRFYRIARRSAAEVACVLDALLRLHLIEPSVHEEGTRRAREIGTMLLRMIYSIRPATKRGKSRQLQQARRGDRRGPSGESTS